MKIFVNVTLLKTKPLFIYSISYGEVVLENMKIFVNVTLLVNPQRYPPPESSPLVYRANI